MYALLSIFSSHYTGEILKVQQIPVILNLHSGKLGHAQANHMIIVTSSFKKLQFVFTMFSVQIPKGTTGAFQIPPV